MLLVTLKLSLSTTNAIFVNNSSLVHLIRQYNTRCIFATQARTTFPRTYLTKLYLEDGSTLTVRCDLPRKFIKLPFDLSTVNDNEKRKLWISRKSNVKVDEAKNKAVDDFDASKYKQFWK